MRGTRVIAWYLFNWQYSVMVRSYQYPNKFLTSPCLTRFENVASVSNYRCSVARMIQPKHTNLFRFYRNHLFQHSQCFSKHHFYSFNSVRMQSGGQSGLVDQQEQVSNLRRSLQDVESNFRCDSFHETCMSY